MDMDQDDGYGKGQGEAQNGAQEPMLDTKRCAMCPATILVCPSDAHLPSLLPPFYAFAGASWLHKQERALALRCGCPAAWGIKLTCRTVSVPIPAPRVWHMQAAAAEGSGHAKAGCQHRCHAGRRCCRPHKRCTWACGVCQAVCQGVALT
jgi:hypothetical protein